MPQPSSTFGCTMPAPRSSIPPPPLFEAGGEASRGVPYPEAAPAIVGHYLPLCDDVHMITVVPRGGAGGFTLSLPRKLMKS